MNGQALHKVRYSELLDSKIFIVRVVQYLGHGMQFNPPNFQTLFPRALFCSCICNPKDAYQFPFAMMPVAQRSSTSYIKWCNVTNPTATAQDPTLPSTIQTCRGTNNILTGNIGLLQSDGQRTVYTTSCSLYTGENKLIHLHSKHSRHSNAPWKSTQWSTSRRVYNSGNGKEGSDISTTKLPRQPLPRHSHSNFQDTITAVPTQEGLHYQFQRLHTWLLTTISWWEKPGLAFKLRTHSNKATLAAMPKRRERINEDILH